MELKTLEKILDYLPVVVATGDRYGWMGSQGLPIPKTVISDIRLFFDKLLSKISIKDIPEIEDILPNMAGGVILLWETDIDPIKYIYDSFEITFYGDESISYKSNLESIGVSTRNAIELSEGIDSDILQNLSFFKRKQDEQREIQKSTALKPATNKCLQ